MDAHLQHDCAFSMATALLEIVQNCIREEEQQDAFAEFYRVAHAGIEVYQTMKQRQDTRLRPSNN